MVQLCRWWFSCLKSFHICFKKYLGNHKGIRVLATRSKK
jgi:hypothetical protein